MHRNVRKSAVRSGIRATHQLGAAAAAAAAAVPLLPSGFTSGRSSLSCRRTGMKGASGDGGNAAARCSSRPEHV